MAVIKLSYKSEQLSKDTVVNIILPEMINDRKIPVLYLLHGLSDDQEAWMKYSSIARYVRNKYLAVVMPDAGKSFYSDMKYGLNYYSYITEELPIYLSKIFPLSHNREETFIAGLSMGGYGSFKIALKHPERFVAAASFSGALNVCRLLDERNDVAFPIIGNDTDFRSFDLFEISKQASKALVKPRLYQSCGTEDFLYEDNLKFKNHLEGLRFEHTYREFPGAHEWQIWDKEIETALSFFNIT